MTFAEKLIELRKKYAMSQQDLADKAGISQTSVYYMEKGKRQPKIETLMKLANAFNISLVGLLGGCENRYEIAANLNDPTLIESLNILDDIRKGLRKENSKNHLARFKNNGNNTIEGESLKTNIMLKHYQQLNESGQDKAIEQVEMLTKIPEYRKDTE